MAKCKTCGAPVNLAPDGDPKYQRPLVDVVQSSVERAYGLLWMCIGDDPKVHEARRILLDQISRDGQKRGIEFANSKYTMPSIESVLHKLT